MYNINLKSLPYVTAQEVFDQIAYGMLRQMKMSQIGFSYICAYRGANKTKCAAGMIMDDSEILDEDNEKGYSTLLHEKKVPKEHFELIYGLQQIHDSGQSPSNWHHSLKRFAKNNNLEFDF